MPGWKRRTLQGYYAASWPLRTIQNGCLAVLGRTPIVAITYHRVADDGATAWTISNSEFRQQIDWLEQHFDLVSLSEAQRCIAAQCNHRPTVAITFDDGYADNCREALPLLLSRGIPFTYFVTGQPLLEGSYFQHDLKLGHRLKPNTVEQLRELAAAGAEIGAHTRTHADLGRIVDPRRLYDEVVVARDEMQDAIGCPIRYFAFPFGQHGNLSREVFHLAAAAGYEAVVSAYGGYNFPGGDPFHIQRACVDGPRVRLKNWVTLDPYKQWKIRRFEYQ